MKKLNSSIQAIAFILVMCLFVINIMAQDVRYSQSFYGSPLKVNPAVMGMNSDLRAMINYRSQWSVIDDGGYTTASFTALMPFYMKSVDRKLDVGLSIVSDDAGAFKTLDLSLALGYNMPLGNSGSLSLSLIGGIVQRTLDLTGLSYDDQFVLGSYSASNPTSTSIANDVISQPAVGFGLMWYHNPSRNDARLNAYAGFSGFQLNNPDVSRVGGSNILPSRLAYQAGVKIFGDNKIDFTPNFVVTSQNGSEEFAAGLYLDYNMSDKAALVLGLWYRQNDAFATMIAVNHKSFFLGYSYDVPTSQIGTLITGLNTHEISLAYKMNMAEKKGYTANKSMF